MKPIIGVLPLVDAQRNSFWMLPGYFRGIEQAGGLPIMLPLTEDKETIQQIVERCDGFLFTGGHDVAPERYHEQRLEGMVDVCPPRDSMEWLLLDKAIAAEKPVLGICRGIQLLNVAFGGSLYQDLPTQRNSAINHHQSPPYDRPVHTNKVLSDTPLHDLLHADTIAVNSYHHQAVKRLAEPLCAMAVSEDGLIEAVYQPDCRFLWAVQWHPEFSFHRDKASANLFRALIDSSSGI